MSTPLLTAHTIVKNEERFVGYAIASVLPFVDQLLIFDTGSTDNTVAIIQSFNSEKIVFSQKGSVDRAGLVRLRNEQLQQTKSTWLLNLDGDEVYPKATITEVVSLLKSASKEALGLVIPFYNWVGDIYHVQKESAGRYRFGNRTGHLNLRGVRVLPEVQVVGSYPNEAYTYQSVPIQEYTDRLVFANKKFFHAGNLRRSSLDGGVMERHQVLDLGISYQDSLPEVMGVYNAEVCKPRSRWYVGKSTVKALAKRVLKKA